MALRCACDLPDATVQPRQPLPAARHMLDDAAELLYAVLLDKEAYEYLITASHEDKILDSDLSSA